MSGWWLSGLMMVGLTVALVNSRVDLDSPLRLAHCRASCLRKMSAQVVSDMGCHAELLCSQCWDSCRHVLSNQHTRTFCSSWDCGPGCLEACRFHLLSPSEKPPVLLTQHEEVLTLSDSRVSWPPAGAETVPVYVVMGREVGRPWSQLCQTLEVSARIPSDVEQETVRVLVVDWRGLTKVLSPQPQPSLVLVQTIIRSLGLDGRMGLPQQKYQSVQDKSTKTSALSKPLKFKRKQWRLEVMSVIHEPVLVLAQVSWEPQQLAQDTQLMYLVTWEVDGGVLRGNLLTNSSRVTLSLWPDTVYRIQVELLNSESPSSSEPLILDTHHSQQESTSTASSHLYPSDSHSHTGSPTTVPSHKFFLSQSDTPSTASSHLYFLESQMVGGKRTQLVGVVAAAVAMFLVLTLTMTWRWLQRVTLPHAKLIAEEAETPNLYRVFPPVIRLIGDSREVAPHLFSSRDNLLQKADP